MAQEIERKFWLSAPPDWIDNLIPTPIAQGYLAAEANGREVRLRNAAEEYTLTVKGGTGMTRAEYEIAISREQFSVLWPGTKGRRLRKKRYVHRLPQGLTLELYRFRKGLGFAKPFHASIYATRSGLGVPARSTAEQNHFVVGIDVYEEPLEGLWIGEVEFPDEQSADAFTPPEWFGQEVTDKTLFKNQNLLRFPTLEALRDTL